MWKSTKLAELFIFKNGLNKGKEFFGHGTPIVNYMDVNKNTAITSANIHGLVDVNASELKNCSANFGDMFLAVMYLEADH